ncbi:hypothetical protein M3201_00370 [Paenibacillus motobuensis]|uniref:hypothetical protein n=1 Tax=Paenibacillus TaxID=44249 RepID=UPI00203E00B4|nr:MULTISPECIES: hypothetical protein [Paenibacillus]MCM3038157.1 hypothetical protein [Paenibacillus lutimineralis]MCM3645261.1 hypothetical protein [Paenibacillus motobuensis]
MQHKSRFMKPLTSDIHLYTAQMEQTPIVVFIAYELVGSGRIEGVTENSVMIGGERFLRELCTFKYAC